MHVFRLMWSAMILVAVVASTMTGLSVEKASASAAAPCTQWTNLERRYPVTGPPPYRQGTADTSVILVLQYRRCTFDGTPRQRYRVAVTNVRPSGKLDIAVGLKVGGGVCGERDNRVLGTWHPIVPAPTTWAGPEFDATSFGPREGRTIFADMHVAYPRADYWAWTDPCRDIP